ncbi:hypothetical protein [Arsenicicoccus dermatophilus]
MRLVCTPHGGDDCPCWLGADGQIQERVDRLVDGDRLVVLPAGLHHS